MRTSLPQQPCRILGKVSQDQLRSSAADRRERFEDHAVAVQPAILDGGLQHGVFSGNLVGGDGQVFHRAYFNDACVVDEHVDAAEVADGVVDEHGCLVGVGQVGGDEEDVVGGLNGFAIEDAETGAFLGIAGLVAIERAANQGEIGYVVRREARGQGIAGRALRLVTEYALGEVGLARVVLMIQTDNEPSIRVAEKCGFAGREPALYRGESILLFRRPKPEA